MNSSFWSIIANCSSGKSCSLEAPPAGNRKKVAGNGSNIGGFHFDGMTGGCVLLIRLLALVNVGFVVVAAAGLVDCLTLGDAPRFVLLPATVVVTAPGPKPVNSCESSDDVLVVVVVVARWSTVIPVTDADD